MNNARTASLPQNLFAQRPPYSPMIYAGAPIQSYYQQMTPFSDPAAAAAAAAAAAMFPATPSLSYPMMPRPEAPIPLAHMQSMTEMLQPGLFTPQNYGQTQPKTSFSQQLIQQANPLSVIDQSKSEPKIR